MNFDCKNIQIITFNPVPGLSSGDVACIITMVSATCETCQCEDSRNGSNTVSTWCIQIVLSSGHQCNINVITRKHENSTKLGGLQTPASMGRYLLDISDLIRI